MKKICAWAICCFLLIFSGCSDVSFGVPPKEETDSLDISSKEETDSLNISSEEETENVISSNSALTYSTELQETESNVTDSDPDMYLEDFSFSTNLNVYSREGDAMTSPCRHVFEVPSDKNLSLSLVAKADPDKSIECDNVPTRIYVLGDGKPLKFRLKDSSDGASSEIYSEINIEKSKDTRIDIDVDLSKSDDIKIIHIICDYLPERIPKKGLGGYSGYSIYPMTNKKYSKETETGEDGDNSLYYELSCKDKFIDIGVNSLEDVDQTTEDYIYNNEDHFYNDIDLNGKSKDLYVKLNSGRKVDIPCYMLLFCDGKLLDAFDGEYSKKIDCHSGERSFQFRIPEKYIPQDGLHTFYAIALPVYTLNNDSEVYYFSIYTQKIRVRV